MVLGFLGNSRGACLLFFHRSFAVNEVADTKQYEKCLFDL